MRYLISDLTASRVNLLQNDYAAGIPSPMAFLGLASVLSMRLGMPRHLAKVLPILTSVTESPGRTKPEMERNGSVLSNVEIPEDLLGHVEFSMLIEFPDETNEEDVAEALRGLSLAGGIIFARRHGQPFRVAEVEGDGYSLLRGPRGRAVVPGLEEPIRGKLCFGAPGEALALRELLLRTDKLQADAEAPIAEADPDANEDLDDTDDEEPKKKQVDTSIRVAVAAGYRLLNRPGEHPVPHGARDGVTPHVFAEPCAGIAELISVRNPRLTELDAEALGHLMWSWSVTERHIAAHPAYNPEIA